MTCKHRSIKRTLIVLRGLPGSGKTTLASMMLNCCMNAHAYSADDYFINSITGDYAFNPEWLPAAHAQCRRNVERKLANAADLGTEVTVIVHNTCTTSEELLVFEELAEKYNARFMSLIVENRHGNESVHNVPQHTIEAMRERFQVKL